MRKAKFFQQLLYFNSFKKYLCIYTFIGIQQLGQHDKRECYSEIFYYVNYRQYRSGSMRINKNQFSYSSGTRKRTEKRPRSNEVEKLTICHREWK